MRRIGQQGINGHDFPSSGSSIRGNKPLSTAFERPRTGISTTIPSESIEDEFDEAEVVVDDDDDVDDECMFDALAGDLPPRVAALIGAL